MMLKPDPGPTTCSNLSIETAEPPKIFIGTTALMWIKQLVQLHDGEVGFFGVVDTLPENSYFIRDIFYLKHNEANHGTCEISPEGEHYLMNYLLDKGRQDDISKVRFWGHSHHTMGVSPSQQDEDEAVNKMTRNQSFFIRAICNKQELVSISFFDYEHKRRFDKIQWTAIDDTPQIYYDEKINKMIEIINTPEVTSKKKLVEIITMLNKNNLEVNIKEKILELKKINMPERASDHFNYGVHYLNNMSIPFNRNSVANQAFNQDNYANPEYFKNKDKDNSYNESAIDSAMKEFEKEKADELVEEWRQREVMYCE